VILSLGACRLYGEPTRICNVCGLRRERNGSRSGERQTEAGEHHKVSVKGDLGKSVRHSSALPFGACGVRKFNFACKSASSSTRTEFAHPTGRKSPQPRLARPVGRLIDERSSLRTPHGHAWVQSSGQNKSADADMATSALRRCSARLSLAWTLGQVAFIGGQGLGLPLPVSQYRSPGAPGEPSGRRRGSSLGRR